MNYSGNQLLVNRAKHRFAQHAFVNGSLTTQKRVQTDVKHLLNENILHLLLNYLLDYRLLVSINLTVAVRYSKTIPYSILFFHFFSQVLSYDALEKHEECSYQFLKCPGCRAEVLKKDFSKHTSSCGSIELTCQDCKLIYKRGDAGTKHTESVCLREQLRQLRNESKENKREIQELTLQLNEMCAFGK